VETRGGKTFFYMPTFGARTLDAAAAASFQQAAGCQVIPIDCSHIWHLGGSLHCLISVVARE
jgi:agmatine/peptidylarginine deiminase